MKALNPQVAAKYQLIAIRPGKYNFKGFGEIDLCSLSIARADDLFRRGFPHFRLREVGTETQPAAPAVSNLKARSLKTAAAAPTQDPGPDLDKARANKPYVNKLLTLNWEDLSHQDKLVFFNDQTTFLEKKKLLFEISAIDQKMKSCHAKVKAIAQEKGKAQERQEIMEQMKELEADKLEKFNSIDTWITPQEKETQGIAKAAAAKALERDKLIKAHGNYIYRAELALPNMPVKTAQEKKRKAEKQAEVDRRKKELEEIGAPYNRQTRK